MSHEDFPWAAPDEAEAYLTAVLLGLEEQDESKMQSASYLVLGAALVSRGLTPDEVLTIFEEMGGEICIAITPQGELSVSVERIDPGRVESELGK